jgi:hypothetical protein
LGETFAVAAIPVSAVLPAPALGAAADLAAIAVAAVVPSPQLAALDELSALAVTATLPALTIGEGLTLDALTVTATLPAPDLAAVQSLATIEVVAVVLPATYVYAEQRNLSAIAVTATLPAPTLAASVDLSAIAVNAVVMPCTLGVWGLLIEPGIDAKQALRLCLAAVTGRLSGANGSSVTIKTPDGGTTRIVAGVGPRGNRDVKTLAAGDVAGADDGWDATLETGLTIRQAVAVLLSMLAGDLSVSGTSAIATKACDGADTRVQQSVDRYGNRSAVTLTPPSY